MMQRSRISLQFCGFGGQGLVLSATVFGTAAVYAGLNAVQTQSYGSEARGGECQAELILSEEPINSPTGEKVDILVAMSQAALDRYLERLKPGGMLLIDPRYVTRPERTDARLLEVPVTQIAIDEIGQQITANMVMLGFLRETTELIPEDALVRAIDNSVPERFLAVNLKAVQRGKTLALKQNTSPEV